LPWDNWARVSISSRNRCGALASRVTRNLEELTGCPIVLDGASREARLYPSDSKAL